MIDLSLGPVVYVDLMVMAECLTVEEGRCGWGDMVLSRLGTEQLTVQYITVEYITEQ